MLHINDGSQLFNIQDIVYCEADANYSKVIFNDGKEILVSRNLGQIEKALQDFDFARIHQSRLVNLRYIHNYRRGNFPSITIKFARSIEAEFNITDTYRRSFIEKMERFAKSI